MKSDKLLESTQKALQGKLIEDKQSNLGKLSVKNFLNYLTDNNYLKLGDKNIYKIIIDKLKQNGYSKEELPLKHQIFDNSVYDDILKDSTIFTDYYFEPVSNDYRISDNKAARRQEFIKYIQKVKKRCNDRELYGYFTNSYYGPEIRLYVLNDYILDRLNNTKSPEEIKKQRIEKQKDTQLKVNEIYESILQEFEDDMTDLYTAYDKCNGTLESFIKQLNSWGQDWLLNIKDNYNCSTSISRAVTKKLFDYISTNIDKEN